MKTMKNWTIRLRRRSVREHLHPLMIQKLMKVKSQLKLMSLGTSTGYVSKVTPHAQWYEIAKKATRIIEGPKRFLGP